MDMQKVKTFLKENKEPLIYFGGALVLTAGLIYFVRYLGKSAIPTGAQVFTPVQNSPYAGLSIAEIKARVPLDIPGATMKEALVVFHNGITDIHSRALLP